MKRVLLSLCLALGILPALAADEPAAPRDMVVLTVSGMIGKTNRGPLDPRKDSLLALQKVDFREAFAFDRAMLLGLPQGTVKAQPPEFDAPATFKGPLLGELLGYLETAKVKITFMAVDGYTGWLDPDDIDTSDWILAVSYTHLTLPKI
ncbi:MAG TPA: molybdopterin-dependent oxidoreductase, partial [Rhizobiales bacterium]|nr:molybdopterin-dependent oxidoreductase [Hyphomicrobiales bacterium]